ncbi:hypothetical protein ACFX19_002793 [Malus domestica]
MEFKEAAVKCMTLYLFSFLFSEKKPRNRTKGQHLVGKTLKGTLEPANIENMFSKYAHTMPDKFTLEELWTMTKGNKVAFDFFG